jgi:hypothetical protein
LECPDEAHKHQCNNLNEKGNTYGNGDSPGSVIEGIDVELENDLWTIKPKPIDTQKRYYLRPTTQK